MKITLRVNGGEQSHDVEPRPSTDEAAVRAACESAAEGVEPLGDIHANVPYRANLARVLCRRAARAAISRARGSGN